MAQPRDPNGRGAFERHAQTVLQVVIAAGILGLANFAWESQRTFGQLQAELSSIGTDLSRLSRSVEGLTQNAETKADHDRDMATVAERLIDHEKRIRDMERGAGPRR